MNKWKYTVGILVLALITAITAVISYPTKNLRLITCDVGQGDSTLVIYGEVQILIDGGPGNRVLTCLSNNIPFWDKRIELVMLTHPQTDHFGGLNEVFGTYEVNTFIHSGLDSGSQGWKVLENTIGGTDTKVIYAESGMTIRLGKIYLDIVHPTKELIARGEKINEEKVLGMFTSKEDPNEYSVMTILSLGEFDAFFTGDASIQMLDELVEGNTRNKLKNIEYIKIPHHGSKNSVSKKLYELIEPKVAVIPVGKNSYGHPHEDILKILTKNKIRTLRTDEMGEIEIITDGEKVWVE